MAGPFWLRSRLFHPIMAQRTKDYLAMKRKIITAIVLGTLVTATAACNTVRGLGDDLKSVADAVDDET